MKKVVYFFTFCSLALSLYSLHANLENENDKQKFAEVVKEYEKEIANDPHNFRLIVAVAEVYYSLKNYDQAVHYYTLALELEPDNLKIKTSLAQSYLGKNDWDRSKELFDQILKVDPNNYDAISGIGRIEALKHHYAQAETLYQQVLKNDPNHFSTEFYMGELRIEQKRYDEALDILTKLSAQDPSATWINQALKRAKLGPILEKEQFLEQLGDYPSAISLMQKQLSIDPNVEEVYLNLARLQRQSGNYNEAIALANEGLKRFPNENFFYLDLAFTYLAKKDLKNATENLELAAKYGASQSDVDAILGKIAAVRGNIRRAERLFDKSLHLNPVNTLTLSYMAQLRIDQRQYADAEKLFEKIIQIDPKAFWAKQALDEVKLTSTIDDLENKNRFDEAVSIYQKMIEQSPKGVNNYLKLGKLYIKAKKFPEAIATYQRALAVDPQSKPVHLALGFAYLVKGDLDPGKNTFTAILKIDPENPDAMAGLGRYYELNGNKKAAIHYYQEALDQDKNNITALVYLANLTSNSGDYEKASILYTKLMELDPAESWVKLAYQDSKHGLLLKEIKEKDEAKEYKQEELLWQQLLKEAPNVANYYLKAGLFYQRVKEYQKAIDTYMTGIKLDPKSSELFAALGLAYISLQEYDKAYAAFKHSLHLDPKNPDAIAGLADVALMRDQYDQANDLIQKALALDADRIAVLSTYGNILMKEKRYAEAQQVYEKLLTLRPKEKWISLSLDDAKNGHVLDQIRNLVKEEQFSEAAAAYQELLQTSPDNPNYYYGLGQMYMRLRQYGQSIRVNKEALEKNPDENELHVALGFAYFLNKDLDNARQALTEANEIDAKNPEALAGLGRVNALEKDNMTAEKYYIQALEIDPKNLSAITFYGDLLMKERRYDEALTVLEGLQKILPSAEWVKRLLQDARDGPLTDIAQDLANREEYELAADIYRSLINASPNDPARYLPLGQMFVNLQEYCCGLQVFNEGLMIDPEAWYLWREIGFTYIILEDYCLAQWIFEDLVTQDPDDAESWAGLGRIQAKVGTYCMAHEYYSTALDISPQNQITLSFLADLQQNEMYNFSSLSTYDSIYKIADAEQGDSCRRLPKWLTRGYNNALNLTSPTITLSGAYHEEDQWDPTLHRWSAEYQVFGGKALINYPYNDEHTFWASVQDQFFILKDLLTRKNIYSFDVQRLHIGNRYVYDQNWYIDGRLGFTDFSKYQNSTFHNQHGSIIEPSLTVTYHNPIEKATMYFVTNSDLIARSFSKNKAKLVGYYTLGATYERRIMKRGWIGFEADGLWFNDYVSNNAQSVLGWCQWRPPYYSDNILFRYFSKYQTFAKNIPDYYTYKPQYINQLQAKLEKFWRVYWADTFYTSLSYSHGWQNTHTRFPQIIVIVPTGTNPPYVWDDRQFDIVTGLINYRCGRLQWTFTADYYRDTEKYTIWNIAGELTWRF